MNYDISTDLYKIFCVVVRTGSMSEAAQTLYISQPAVSMAIKQLENRLGSPLLHRSSKGITTTKEGSVLYGYLNQAFNLIDAAEKKYAEMINLNYGEIKIGASDTIISQYLISYIEKFVRLNPKINFKATNRMTSETIKLLKSGQVDVGFINLPLDIEDSSLEKFECMKIHDCLVGGTKFLNLADSGIGIKELTNYPLLMLENDSTSRKFLNKYAYDQGVILQPNIELGSSDLLLKFAKINLGLTFIIKEFSAMEIDNKTLFEIPLYPEIPGRSIGLIKLRGVSLSHAANSFVDSIFK